MATDNSIAGYSLDFLGCCYRGEAKAYSCIPIATLLLPCLTYNDKIPVCLSALVTQHWKLKYGRC